MMERATPQIFLTQGMHDLSFRGSRSYGRGQLGSTEDMKGLSGLEDASGIKMSAFAVPPEIVISAFNPVSCCITDDRAFRSSFLGVS